jgi:hypothetical protein
VEDLVAVSNKDIDMPAISDPDSQSHPHNGIFAARHVKAALESLAAWIPLATLGGRLETEAISLSLGGRYDINRDWQKPHGEHRKGLEIDLSHSPFTGVQRLVVEALLKSLAVVGRVEVHGPRPHWHVRFLDSRDTTMRPATLGVPRVRTSTSPVAAPCPPGANQFQATFSSSVSPDPGGGLRYEYVVVNDAASAQAITSLRLTAVGAANPTAPPGWDVLTVPDPDQPQVLWIAAVDSNGNTPAAIDPGHTLAGFGFSSAHPAEPVVAHLAGNGAVPEFDLEEEAEDAFTACASELGPVGVATSAPLDVIFADDAESGSLSRWSVVQDGGGDLSATTTAALQGAYGLQAIVNDQAPLYVEDAGPQGESRYRAAFEFDPNGFDPGTASGRHRVRLLAAFGGAPARRLLVVVLRYRNGVYSVQVRVLTDANTRTDTPFIDVTDEPHSVQLDWIRSSGPHFQNGRLELWIDGESVAVVDGIDNDQRGIDSTRLGVFSIKAGAQGTVFLDWFDSRRATFIAR